MQSKQEEFLQEFQIAYNRNKDDEISELLNNPNAIKFLGDNLYIYFYRCFDQHGNLDIADIIYKNLNSEKKKILNK
ncbi:MAG: hypothetical protein J0G32_03230 [Alphaproteobacteria bacterium]|nr:hypothetical protein [Alphaproteobacteria bacterium]OJV12087.1 MAG: hypothetical protein BGO27_05025 [Alphaproteobacteria bacterium 33-17]